MTIEVNGAERQVPDGATVTVVLQHLNLPTSGTAVALNGQVVPRVEHATTVVPAWARLEVLTAVQGG
ncbi:sulfur carrier protein ThiS [Actinokineospora pegani]|uniref:sulfur carrier protein ThiS n=1 Tax=Actinokineospora pegani TaxID=2654637 RepID=UPI0012E9AFD2|nr:sulfur carrier protein ThiS [Actinokineospora pegani]